MALACHHTRFTGPVPERQKCSFPQSLNVAPPPNTGKADLTGFRSPVRAAVSSGCPRGRTRPGSAGSTSGDHGRRTVGETGLHTTPEGGDCSTRWNTARPQSFSAAIMCPQRWCDGNTRKPPSPKWRRPAFPSPAEHCSLHGLDAYYQPTDSTVPTASSLLLSLLLLTTRCLF